MKRLSYILTAAILAASCEIPFSLEENAEPRIYLQCVAGPDSTAIMARYAQPAFSNAKKDEFPQIYVFAEVDGKQLPCRDNHVMEGIAPGSRIEIHAQADGLESAYGEVIVPPKPDVTDMEIEYIEDKAIKVRISLARKPEKKEYYGLQIIRKIEMEDYSFDVFLTPQKALELDELEYLWQAGNSIQFYLDSGLISLENYMGDLVTILSPDDWDKNTYTFYIPNESFMDVGDYKLVLSRLTPEIYHYANSLNKSSFDFLANLGLTPANFTWSNVKGGIGCVGAISSVHYTIAPFSDEP